MGQHQGDEAKPKANKYRNLIGSNKRRVHPGDDLSVGDSDPGTAVAASPTTKKDAEATTAATMQTQAAALQSNNSDNGYNRHRFLGGGRLHHPSTTTLSSASIIQAPSNTTPNSTIKLHHQQYPSFKGGLHYIYNRPGSSMTTIRQPSMSNMSYLEMHPRIQSKDANYFYIWIDDQYKDLSLSKPLIPPSKMTKRNFTLLSKRGACNMITILIVLSMILGLFVYPFFTYFYTQQQLHQQQPPQQQ